MNFFIHGAVMAFVFLAGLISFICYSSNHNFLMGIIIFTLSMLFVNLYNFSTRTLSQKSIFYLFSGSIFLVALSVFGNYGIEQKPIEYQTLYQFKLEGVATSLMLFLLSSLLLIIGKNQKAKNIQVVWPNKSIGNKKEKKTKNIIESDDWQEASIQDLQSGQYQIYK